MGFMNSLKKTLNREFNTSVTENGAAGCRTTGRNLLDLNFAVASLRHTGEEEIIDKFVKAFYEDRRLAVIWLFFASDVREGLGERRLFRICLRYLAENHPDIAEAVLELVPEYSRWDNLLCLLDTGLRPRVVTLVKNQLDEDVKNRREEQPISLCAKWLPSVNASSRETRRLARMLAEDLGMTERRYRKTLADLRSYLRLVEVSMSAGAWADIDYKAVPSRANLVYNRAFLRNDEERRRAYLEDLKKGETTIHAGVLYPHDIVHRYFEGGTYRWNPTLRPEDDTLEALWKALPDYVGVVGNTLCVSDGSGSMTSPVGSTGVSCLDVANALSVYFSEHCSGQFRNKYITFSTNPQFVDFGNARTLREKLEIARRYNEVANTNIEAVFDLILQTAKYGRMSQEELPATVLILSDMEFDAAAKCNNYMPGSGSALAAPTEKLFETLGKRYAASGYRLPRLVFWNICSRTCTIPVRENQLGAALVSGFSVTIMKMVLSGETDPYKCLLEQLETKRYEAVDTALKTIDK